MKICIQCGETKPAEEFRIRLTRSKGCGFHTRCADCRKANRIKYAATHREIHVEKQREYYREHKEELKGYKREYYLKNRAKFLAYHKVYYQKHREEILAQARNYKNKNREKFRARDLVKSAITTGKLIRSKICEFCTCKAYTDAHHSDYTQPLNVLWFCKSCHKKLHAALKRASKQADHKKDPIIIRYEELRLRASHREELMNS